ncbi:MAG: hypothetical protein C5B53_06230 [Candidatus Melainabacteria bacterium]|nr:MAG: hypothetical protein C5B53_06230 [Candidatus Melainabacteria bacterium]
MDVIVEGKITAEEGVDEVLQTIIDLKTVANPVLRINCLDARFQGKIGFAQGGFILGAKIDETGELGYPAVRRLLMVRNGNYAILDPEKQVVQDINQTLWLDAEKVIQVLPDMPQLPDGLVGAHPSAATTTLVYDRYEEPSPVVRRPAERASVGGVNSKARQFNPSDWRRRYAMLIGLALILIILAAAYMYYGDQILALLHTFIK